MQTGRDEDLGDDGVLPAINSFVDPHKKWLLKQLYEVREEEGDVVLVVSTAAGSGDDPMDGTEPTRLRCHSQVLISQSKFFKD